MIKKIAFSTAGLLLLATPLVLAAQTTTSADSCSATPTIQCLESEIQQLYQILQQLLSTHTIAPAHHNSTLSANPNSGNAPLSVTFGGSVPGNTGYMLDFGDGSQPTTVLGISVTCPASGPCTQPTSDPVSATHTYSTNGTYTASLFVGCNAPSGGACGGGGTRVGSVTITVGTPSPSATFTAAPTSGAAPLAVTFSVKSPSGASFVAGSINFGDGNSAPLAGSACTNSIAGSCSASATHTYAAAGVYTATLSTFPTCTILSGAQASCGAEGVVLGTVTITVGAPSSSGTFTATPSSGTSPLSVSLSGTIASYNGGAYTINYGDGVSSQIGIAGCVLNSACPINSSHTYASAGTYTATLIQGSCTCPFSGICNCPNLSILGAATITVSAAQSAGKLTATPLSGAAPLTVTFSSTQAGTINFGDGQSAATNSVPTCVSGLTVTAFCTTNSSILHTYASPGTYIATLTTTSGGTSCPNASQGSSLSNVVCTPTPAITQTIGTVTVQVVGTQGNTALNDTSSQFAAAIVPIEAQLQQIEVSLINFLKSLQ